MLFTALCPILPSPRYGNVRQSGQGTNSLATYTCNDGYHISSLLPTTTSLTIACNGEVNNGVKWPVLSQPICVADDMKRQLRTLVLYLYHGDHEWNNLLFFINVSV
jgi:hypothetical protein